MNQSTAAIITAKGKILIGKRKSGGSLSGKWEFPGGKVDAGEKPEESLVRELEEEMGIKSVAGPLLGRSSFENNGKKYELLAFKIKSITGNIRPIEHVEYQWVSFDELMDYDFAPSDISLFPVAEEELKRNTDTVFN